MAYRSFWGGSGRLDTRLDTPPSINRRHPNSCLAPVGLDGSQQFVAMACSHSQCEVLHQDFLAMHLPESRFDGIFANASLFHVPSQELQRVLLELFQTLKPRGVLFSSNPRGNNEEGFTDDRVALTSNLPAPVAVPGSTMPSAS